MHSQNQRVGGQNNQFHDDQQQYNQQLDPKQTNPQLYQTNGRQINNSQYAPGPQQEEEDTQGSNMQIEQESQFSCPDHPEQIIKFIIAQKDIPENMSRLACQECIASTKAAFSQDCCILEDLCKDEIALLKHTNFDLFLQRFCNLFYNNEPKLYPTPEDLIKRIFKKFKQLFLYRLEEMEKTLVQKAQAAESTNHKIALKKLVDLKEELKSKINTQQLFQAIDQFQQSKKIELDIEIDCESVMKVDHTSLFSYQWQKLNSTVNEFIQNSLYNSETKKQFQNYEGKLQNIQDLQNGFYNQSQLKATTDKILFQLDQLKYVFDKRFLTNSEISDNFLNKILTEELAYKSKLIYRSSRDGLNYRKIQDLSDQFLDKQSLYIFETFTGQKFGVYIDIKTPKNSLIFHMTKRHKYQYLGTEPIMQFDKKALSSDPLFKFCGQDLVISANMIHCTSNLGKGFDIQLQKQFIADNTKGYLGNAEVFRIKNMEILVFE